MKSDIIHLWNETSGYIHLNTFIIQNIKHYFFIHYMENESNYSQLSGFVHCQARALH
jgi:hypothetical protein